MNNTTLRTLWTRNNITSLKLEDETLHRQNTNINVKSGNKIQPFIKQISAITSEFELLNILTIDGDVVDYYKQWQIQIYESTIPTELEYMLEMISANLAYSVIYNESVENILDYYNTGNEMRKNGYFSLEGNIIFFNVSVFISQTFGATVITNPEVKLEINIKPFLTVKN